MMRYVLILVGVLGWGLPWVYADHTVIVNRGSIAYPEQIQEDLVVTYPVCRGTWNPDCFGVRRGCYQDPPCRLEFTATEMRFTVPDSITAAQVRQVVQNYRPRLSSATRRHQRRTALRAKLKAGTLTEEELEELVP